MIGLILSALVGAVLASPIDDWPTPKASHEITPLIAPAPTPAPRAFRRQNNGLTTIPVSSCQPYADPDNNIDGVCQCSGYTGFVTTTGNGGCNYTAITMAATTTNPYPYTFTSPNSAIIAYETTTMYGGITTGPGIGIGASSYVQAGKSLTVEINPSATANVGQLTGTSLFTAVSNALVTACGTPVSSSTITSCAPATITDVSWWSPPYLEPSGEIEVTVPLVSVYDSDTMQALIAAIAGAFSASSSIASNSQLVDAWPNTDCGSQDDPCTSDQGPTWTNFTTVNSIAQAIYTVELTNEAPPVQNLEVVLDFIQSEGAGALCSEEALAADSLAMVGAFLAVIGGVPGFEWVEAIGFGLDVANAAIAGTAEGFSIMCEIIDTSGG